MALWRRAGAEGLSALDGEFLVAVWNPSRRELVLVNDRFGLYPHYYTRTAQGLAFAPEIWPLLDVPGSSREPDETAIAQFLRFQQHLGTRTWVSGVSLLAPASILRFSPATGALSIAPSWDWDRIRPEPHVSFDEAVDACIGLFQDAVDVRRQTGRIGIFLSGGLDSRTILGFADRGPRLTTLTYGAPRCRDVEIARRVAARAGTDHHWFPILDGAWARDRAPLHLALVSGQQSWIHAHGIQCLDRARDLIDVHLTGWDGGTILGGSLNFYRDAPFRTARDERTLFDAFYEGFCRHFTWPGLTDAQAWRLLDTAGGRPLRELARDSLASELSATRHLPADTRPDAFYIRQVLGRSLIGQVVTARSAIDVRCPFFDRALIEFLYALPNRIRTTPDFRLTVMTRRLPRLARLQHERTGLPPHRHPAVRAWGHLARAGRSILERSRLVARRPIPYADYEHYLRTDLRPWAEWLLFDRRTEARGLFHPAIVRALWARHLAGVEPFLIGSIVPLMTIEMVLRHLIDGDELETLVPDHLRSRAS